MKIFYFVRTVLHMYPPCLSQIMYLNDLGLEIIVGYGECDKNTKKLLTDRNIRCVDFNIKRSPNKYIGKVQSFLCYKKRALQLLDDDYGSNDIVWFGTADSCFALSGKLNKYHYVMTVLELYDDNDFYRKNIGKVINNADTVIACEDTRASIMKSWWKLTRKPFVMPNKPYSHPERRNMTGSIETTSKMIEKMTCSKSIIYQGIISADRDLVILAKALREMNEDIYLFLMGKEFYDGVQQVKDIYEKTIYLGFAPAPMHLEVTSHATVGVANYDDSCLNNLFCAPNKIYEYSGFGIPILGSDVPGLKNTIEKYKAGECVDFSDTSEIKRAIESIFMNYDEYSGNAKRFYQDTDNFEVMKEIVKQLKISSVEREEE